MSPTQSEQSQRDQVVAQILHDIRQNTPILLPPYNPALQSLGDQFALLSVGLEQNPYGGTLGPYRYQFEGEEDLLHLIIVRLDQAPLSAEEAQSVVSFLFPPVPPSLYWFKPGQQSHHFYIGHDTLLEYTEED